MTPEAILRPRLRRVGGSVQIEIDLDSLRRACNRATRNGRAEVPVVLYPARILLGWRYRPRWLLGPEPQAGEPITLLPGLSGIVEIGPSIWRAGQIRARVNTACVREYLRGLRVRRVR